MVGPEGVPDRQTLPDRSGPPENYLLHTKPSHSDGREFSKHKRLARKMYLNTAFGSTDMILCTLDLMEAAGLDRSEIRIGRRYP